MRVVITASSLVLLLLGGCAGRMGGGLGMEDDTPPTCRAGNMQLCQQQLMRQNQPLFGMSFEPQQQIIQQYGSGMGGGMMPPRMA